MHLNQHPDSDFTSNLDNEFLHSD